MTITVVALTVFYRLLVEQLAPTAPDFEPAPITLQGVNLREQGKGGVVVE